MLWWTYITILYIAAVTADDLDPPAWLDVNILQGPVRGYRDPMEDLYVFYNVPYATAPTGENKFKAPLPPPIWTETYYAINQWSICPQEFVIPWREDCLMANVYLPDTIENNLSVLVYVHGGAFQLGFGEMITLKNFLRNRDVIVVTFNYRLGAHGFLCLGTEDIPGNAGMKDQVALLRWVQQNIAAFGGNPNDVTIAGFSAGASAVDLLMISKSAEGLFNKVIPESGANIGTIAVNNDPLEAAKIFARDLNFTDVDDIKALEQFYKTVPYDLLISNPSMGEYDSTINFVPCVEHENGDEPFLTEAPLSILKRGDYNKVPMLYGFANMEGLYRIDVYETWKEKMNAKFADFLPGDLQFQSEDIKEEVAHQVKQFYFSDQPVDNDSILEYIDYFTDAMFAYSILRAVKIHVEGGHNEVYLYEYSFVDEDIPLIPYTNIRGAEHSAQTMAVADGRNFSDNNEDDITEEFKEMKRIIREMWYNFVKTGKPVPEGSSLPAWPAVGANRSPHMSLGSKVELRGRLLETRAIFWDNIYENYYREPTPPSSSATDKKGRFTSIFVLLIFFYKLLM